MAYDLDPSYVSQLTPMESGDDPNAKNPLSTASGRYQFLDGTFNDVMQNHPELAGADKNDPRVMHAFTMDNAAVLQRTLGREPTKVDLYAAHVLGATGATKFLTADPSTPTTAVVSPEAIAGNRGVFLNPNGSPKTVGQVYATVAPHFGIDPDITATEKPAWYSGDYTHSPQLGPQYADAGNVATDASSVPGLSSMFPNANVAFAPIKQNIADYIKTQPAMWDKLSKMQSDYLAQTKTNPMDGLSDAMNALSQGDAAASALRNATAGGVLLNALPNPQPGIQAAENAHRADLEARQQKLGVAKTAYDIGSQNLLAQNAQGATNLGLQNTAEEGQLNYGLATGKVALELAKFNQQQIKDIGDYIEKAVPNPETRAKVMAAFSAAGNPAASYATNVRVVDGIIQKAQQSGLQISAKEPSQYFRIETWNPEDASQPTIETVNAATPAGQFKLDHLQSNQRPINLATPTTNVTQTSGGGEGGEGGGKTQHTPDQVYSAALTTKQAAEAALVLLPILEKSGGAGPITDTTLANQIQGVVTQLLGPGYDVTNTTVRTLYDKLVSQLGVSQILPQMALIGRGTGMEFQKMLDGQIGPKAQPATARAFLTHLRDTAEWEMGATTSVDKQQEQAEHNNNSFFKAGRARLHYMQDHPPPAWLLGDLTAPPAAETTTATPPVTPGAPPPRTPTIANRAVHGFGDWLYRQVYGDENQHPAAMPQGPAAPTTPPAATPPAATPPAVTQPRNALPGNPIAEPSDLERKRLQP